MRRKIDERQTVVSEVPPRWAQALTLEEFDRFRMTVGPEREMTPRERIHWRLGDFSLTKDNAYLGTRKILRLEQPLYERIMRYCFDHLGYVPIFSRNSWFETPFRAEMDPLRCPDVTLEDIHRGRILGYREKVDGSWVRAATISDGSTQVRAWVGGLNMPAFLPKISAMELVGTTAYSIAPYNATGRIYFGEDCIEFKTRSVHMSVDPLWKDGAIALVATGAGVIEKRIKRVPTAEVYVVGNHTWIGQDRYPVLTPPGGVSDGIYECAYQRGQIIVQAHRPWKAPAADFFVSVRQPSVHNLQSVFPRSVLVQEGPIRYTATQITFPPPLELGVTNFCLTQNHEFYFEVQTNVGTGWETVEAEVVISDRKVSVRTTEAAMRQQPGEFSSPQIYLLDWGVREVSWALVPMRLVVRLKDAPTLEHHERVRMSVAQQDENYQWATLCEIGYRHFREDPIRLPVPSYPPGTTPPPPQPQRLALPGTMESYVSLKEKFDFPPAAPALYLKTEDIIKRLATPKHPEKLWAELVSAGNRGDYTQFEQLMRGQEGVLWLYDTGKWRLLPKVLGAGEIFTALRALPQTKDQLCSRFPNVSPTDIQLLLEGPIRLWEEKEGVYYAKDV